jgi:hypothetical protein
MGCGILYAACVVLDAVFGDMDMYSGGTVIELCSVSCWLCFFFLPMWRALMNDTYVQKYFVKPQLNDLTR